MRIIHIQDYFHPQLGYQETFLMRVQVAAGHEIHMVTSNRNVYSVQDNSDKNRVLGDRVVESREETVEGIRVHRLPCRFGFLQRFYRLWMEGLEKKIEELAPDLIIVHGMQSITSFRVAKYAIRRGKSYKLIFDSHATAWNSFRKFHNLFYLFYRIFQKQAYLKSADAIVAIHPWSVDFLENECGIKPDRVKIIPLGADKDKFKFDLDKRTKKRLEWGIEDDEIVFAYVGKMLPIKGVHIFLEAAIALGKEMEGINIIIVGSGEQSYIEKLKTIPEKQNEVKIKFLPHLHNDYLPEIYSAVDISIWPFEDSIGILEAQSCGLPVIVADAPILNYRISYGNGISYKKGDVSDLKAKMRYLAENPEVRKEMGLKGRKAIEEELNWDTITEDFMQSVGYSL